MASLYQPLHHKYRPQRLADLVGQEAIAATLANALNNGRIAPAYLFCGPRGTGKTSSARILARSLNCLASEGPTPDPCGRCDLCTAIAASNALDVIEIDAASNTGVDNIRELIERSRFAPVQARWKVYVVDECHMLSTAAFNALLKTLEEPPPRVVFVLATTDPQRVLATILSRCQRFDFRRIPLQAMERHLTWIAEQEGIAITPEALHLVAQRAQGGLRDAESLLDQLSLLPPPVEAAAVWDLIGAVPEEELLCLAQAMAAADPLTVVETTRQLLDRGREPNAVLQGIVSLFRDLLLAGVAPDRLELTSVSPPLRSQLPPLAREIGKDLLLRWQATLKGSEQQLRHSVQPRLWLEVLLLGLLAQPQASAPASAAVPAGAPASSKGAPTSGAPSSGAPSRSDPSQGVPAPAPPPSAAAPHRPAPAAAPQDTHPRAAPPTEGGTESLEALWQRILAGLQLPSTRMLLSQQARLKHLDERRAVVRVAHTWITMVQSRLPLLEKAVEATLGSPRAISLEASDRDESLNSPPATATPLAPPTISAPPPPAEPAPARQANPEESAAAKSQSPPSPPARAVPDAVPTPAAPPAPSAGPHPASPSATATPAAAAAASPTPTPAQAAAPGPGPGPGPAKAKADAPVEHRSLETSTQSLAEFFNGQVVAIEAEEED